MCLAVHGISLGVTGRIENGGVDNHVIVMVTRPVRHRPVPATGAAARPPRTHTDASQCQRMPPSAAAAAGLADRAFRFDWSGGAEVYRLWQTGATLPC